MKSESRFPEILFPKQYIFVITEKFLPQKADHFMQKHNADSLAKEAQRNSKVFGSDCPIVVDPYNVKGQLQAADDERYESSRKQKTHCSFYQQKGVSREYTSQRIDFEIVQKWNQHSQSYCFHDVKENCNLQNRSRAIIKKQYGDVAKDGQNTQQLKGPKRRQADKFVEHDTPAKELWRFDED